jgi:hypothetical protein
MLKQVNKHNQMIVLSEQVNKHNQMIVLSEAKNDEFLSPSTSVPSKVADFMQIRESLWGKRVCEYSVPEVESGSALDVSYWKGFSGSGTPWHPILRRI